MKILRLIDDKLEEVLMVLLLIGIVVFMSAQVISRRVFNNSALHIPMYCIQSSPPWWASCCCCSGRVRLGWKASAWR